MIPVIGKLYNIAELNVYVIFRSIRCTRYNTLMSMDLYNDELRNQKRYDYDLEQRIIKEIGTLTLTPVVNKAEMKRRPFDFVDIDGAISLLTKRKRYQNIVCSIDLVQPIKFLNKRYNYQEKKVEQYEDESALWRGYVEATSDGMLKIKPYYNSGVDIIINPFEIERLKFRLYEFTR